MKKILTIREIIKQNNKNLENYIINKILSKEYMYGNKINNEFIPYVGLCLNKEKKHLLNYIVDNLNHDVGNIIIDNQEKNKVILISKSIENGKHIFFMENDLKEKIKKAIEINNEIYNYFYKKLEKNINEKRLENINLREENIIYSLIDDKKINLKINEKIKKEKKFIGIMDKLKEFSIKELMFFETLMDNSFISFLQSIGFNIENKYNLDINKMEEYNLIDNIPVIKKELFFTYFSSFLFGKEKLERFYKTTELINNISNYIEIDFDEIRKSEKTIDNIFKKDLKNKNKLEVVNLKNNEKINLQIIHHDFNGVLINNKEDTNTDILGLFDQIEINEIRKNNFIHIKYLATQNERNLFFSTHNIILRNEFNEFVGYISLGKQSKFKEDTKNKNDIYEVERPYKNNLLIIKGISISSKFRNKGITDFLYRKAIEYAKANNHIIFRNNENLSMDGKVKLINKLKKIKTDNLIEVENKNYLKYIKKEKIDNYELFKIKITSTLENDFVYDVKKVKMVLNFLINKENRYNIELQEKILNINDENIEKTFDLFYNLSFNKEIKNKIK